MKLTVRFLAFKIVQVQESFTCFAYSTFKPYKLT